MINEKVKYEKMYDKDLRDYIDENSTEATLGIMGLESDLNQIYSELPNEIKSGPLYKPENATKNN